MSGEGGEGSIKPIKARPIPTPAGEYLATDLLVRRLSARGDEKWPFAIGNPEYVKFADKLVVPGEKVLDVGIGLGRSSIYFAMHDMEVTGIDLADDAVAAAVALREGYNLPITVRQEDLLTADLGENMYHLAIIDHGLNWFPSTKDAFRVIDKAIIATKPGGYIWIRATGTESSSYRNQLAKSRISSSGVVKTENDNVFMTLNPETEKRESQLFLNPIQLVDYISQRTSTFVHTQVMPQKGEQNIMYGEDYYDKAPETGGFITILAKK